MNTVPEIIDKLGGPTAVGRAINVGASTASEWKRTGRIPVRHWPALHQYATETGVDGLTYDVLVLANVADFPPPSAAVLPGAESLPSVEKSAGGSAGGV